jgi:membrane fusion protein (multidrug efflux system)
MRKSIVIILNIACILLFTGCNYQENKNEAESKTETMRVTTRDVTLTTAYSATMRGRQDIAVFPQLESKIVRLLIEEGQSVKIGQPLFILNQVAQRAALNTAIANEHAAQAALANARLTFAGKMKLYQKKIESAFTIAQTRNQVAQAKAQWEQAHAEVVNARNSLSYTVVRSPSAGVIGSLPYRVGALVSPTMTTPLTYVSDNAEMIAYFSLNQDQLSSLLRKYGSKEKALKKNACRTLANE